MIRVQRVSSLLFVMPLYAFLACTEGPTTFSGGESEIAASMELVAIPMLPVVPDVGRHLLVCPPAASQSASGTFGEEGGTLSVGAHELRIPPGAIREATTFTVTAPSGSLLALQLEYGGGVTSLDRPVVARISYARCLRQDLARRRMTVVNTGGSGDLRLGATAAGITEVGGIDDPVEAAVEVDLRERGTYAVAY